MSTPINTDTQEGPIDVSTMDVNKIISDHLQKGADGKYTGYDSIAISDHHKLAVDTEIRRRNTEASYTKSQQSLREKEAELEVYKQYAPTTAPISTERQEELDELKYSNPDAWFKEMTKINSTANTATAEAVSKAHQAVEFEKRQQILGEFNLNNPAPLTDEQLQYDVPPRLIKRMEAGEISFQEMLTQAHSFVNSGKVISNPAHEGEPSFDGVPGSNEPVHQQNDVNSGYLNIVF